MLAGAEHSPRIGDCGSKLQERCLDLFEACLIPMRIFEVAGAFLVERDRILQGADLPDIVRVGEIDKETDHGMA